MLVRDTAHPELAPVAHEEAAAREHHDRVVVPGAREEERVGVRLVADLAVQGDLFRAEHQVATLSLPLGDVFQDRARDQRGDGRGQQEPDRR